MPWEGQRAGGPETVGRGTWRIGTERTGRVRLRIEAPLSACLLVRAGGPAVRFPLVELLEGPRRSVPPSAVDIGVERLAWDPIEVKLGEAVADGTTGPGAELPLTLGFNILTAEPGEFSVRYSAVVRPALGGDPISREDRTAVVTSDSSQTPTVPLALRAPKGEGSYVIDVEASWEPVAGREGSRISRLIRRRRVQVPATASRSVSFAVLGPKPPAPAVAGKAAETVVETIDLPRVRGHRPTATGRSPAVAGSSRLPVPGESTVEAQRRDILRGLIPRASADLSTLPAADRAGLSWTALGLKVTHPERLHRLKLTVAGGRPSALGVAVVIPGADDEAPRIALDACVAAPSPSSAAEGDRPFTVSWPVWPDASEPVLLLVNRGADPVRLGRVELIELAGDLPPAERIEPPAADAAARAFGADLSAPRALERFGDPDDPLRVARNAASYLSHVGATSAVLPTALADRARRAALDGQADEDATGPDRLDLLLRVFARQGLFAWLDIDCEGPLPGLPASGSAEAVRRGLARIDGRGRADGPEYSPLHPEVQAALKRKLGAAIAPRKERPNVLGLLVRLGRGPTLPGGPETGLDDVSYGRFVTATLGGQAPGQKPGDANRFAARREFVAGPGKQPWLAWRARELGRFYTELARSIRKEAPGALLAVATPGLDDGPAGAEARRGDLSGQPPLAAWQAVGLDLDGWPADEGLLVLRGLALAGDDLGRDLATHPDLDAPVARRAGRGMILAAEDRAGAADELALRAAPLAEGAAGDELLGHALAVIDARLVLLSAAALAGREERAARFAQVFRALPATDAVPPSSARLEAGVAARSWSLGGRTFLCLANDTPYAIRLDARLAGSPAATVDDLGRGLRLTPEAAEGGGRRLVLDLPPFGVAAVRAGEPDARIEAVAQHLLDDHRSLYVALSARLDRLAQGGGAAGPPNPGLEPEAPRTPPAAEIKVVRAAAPPSGWAVQGGSANLVELDTARPHAGLACLRLDAKSPPAAAVTEPFAPPGGNPLTLRAWLRADKPGTKVRVRIEGEAAGRPVVRQAEYTAGTDWAELAVRATDLPAGGLERVRLRFEPLAAGTLWIDDVAMAGQGLSEPERRVRRVLVTAVQAYREGRYADFARLANSHWVRHAPGGAEATAAAPSPLRTGSTSDLPPGRRLR